MMSGVEFPLWFLASVGFGFCLLIVGILTSYYCWDDEKLGLAFWSVIGLSVVSLCWLFFMGIVGHEIYQLETSDYWQRKEDDICTILVENQTTESVRNVEMRFSLTHNQPDSMSVTSDEIPSGKHKYITIRAEYLTLDRLSYNINQQSISINDQEHEFYAGGIYRIVLTDNRKMKIKEVSDEDVSDKIPAYD